ERHLLLVQESTRGLLAIVDDLLDVGKLGAGAVRLEERDVDIGRLVRQTVSFLSSRASAKDLDLRVTVDPELPAPLQADPTRLRQILVNLLSNAIKFTERGHIHVRVQWGAEDSSLRLEVEDSGIGIPEAAVERLFSPFQQVDSSTSRRFGGTGLGLAICKSLAELMDGRIGVDSRRGHGSTFWLELPLGAPTEGSRRQPPTPIRAGELSGRKLLVVEDDEVNRLVTSAKLESLGAAVETASDGRRALERLATERFDLVLMDCQIPELDGYQTTEELRRSQGPNASVPVVALTAHAHPDERTRCLEAGMNDFLTKPVETDELYSTLQEWLETADSLREPSGVITLGGRVV
ncbi:MAG: ATP-binding protein, partial [Acidobacteriota bacterium]